MLKLPTIFAPASGKGKSAIAILRISGPSALNIYHTITRPPTGPYRPPLPANESNQSFASTSSLLLSSDGTAASKMDMRMKNRQDPVPRRATLRKIIDPISNEILDEAIVLYFPPESSLTAQPTLELHTHGSPALMNLLLKRLEGLDKNYRIAEPGEFTRLAFEAGKLDLTQVEGIKDLVESDTEAQRKLAARQSTGQMSKRYNEMREAVIGASSLIEALIDFGEDEGISEGVFESAREKVISLRTQIDRALNDGRRGEIIRDGIKLAIIGAPNAGKSSLLNWLAQREAAIVSSTPGTTRDIIELTLDFHGFPVTIADTAGLRISTEEIESIGVERAKEKAGHSDLKICLLSLPTLFPSSSCSRLTPVIDPLTLAFIDSNTLIVLNKSDLLNYSKEHGKRLVSYLRQEGKEWIGFNDSTSSNSPGQNQGINIISLQESTGLSDLVESLKSILQNRFDLDDDDVADTIMITTARHRRCLEECKNYLDNFLFKDPSEIVLAAEELRYALGELGKIVGVVGVEEVLGEIFRGFCVGK